MNAPLNNINPLLTGIRLPGDTVRIPSRGAFYLNNELSENVKNGEIHVYPMRAIDEITMRSPDKMLSGDAVAEVFAHCIPDVLDVKQLFAKDIDYLMVALRRVTYGNEYEFRHTHDCPDAQRHNYMVDVGQFIAGDGELDPTTYELKHKYVVPRTQQVVMFQPMRYIDLINIMNATIENESAPQNNQNKERSLFQSLLSTIHNVNGVTDKNMIVEWLSSLTAPEVRAMLDKLDTIGDWGPTYNTTITCKDCGEKVELNVPVNPINFFI